MDLKIIRTRFIQVEQIIRGSLLNRGYLQSTHYWKGTISTFPSWAGGRESCNSFLPLIVISLCQLDWDIGCPHIWLSILVVSVRVSSDTVYI